MRMELNLDCECAGRQPGMSGSGTRKPAAAGNRRRAKNKKKER